MGAQPKPIPPGRPRVAATQAVASPRTARSGGERRTGGDRRAVSTGLAPGAGEFASAARGAEDQVSADRAGSSMLAMQVAYLAGTLRGTNIATASVCLLFAVLWGRGGWDDALAPWLALGALSIVLRLILQARYRPIAGRMQADRESRRFLGVATIAAIAGGLMMGWGWLSEMPANGSDRREALLIAQFGMMLWSLHAFRPYLPALLWFMLASMGPAIAVSAGLYGARADVPVGTLSLLILTLVVMGFAVRFSREAHSALRLQDRVQRLLEEVTANRDEAVKATQAKSRFLASVSHDLRQPMHAMNLYLTAVAAEFDRLRSAPPGDIASAQGVQEGIRRLRQSMLYLNSMFESLLDISRLNAGSVAPEIRHTSLAGMLTQLESDYSRQAANQGLRFEVRLPPQIQLMEVETDPALLERLLRNLLVNALRYTRSGGVRLSLRVQGRSLDFRVVDTGPGIDRSMRTRVFEEFFQVPDSQPVSGLAGADVRPDEVSCLPHDDADRAGAQVAGRGIGLGLSISARLADALDSRIRLHSHMGHGSVFAFRQPVRIALRPDADARTVVSREPPVELPAGLFVAVIDDDPEIRRATRHMLEVLGVEVFTAESGVQAVDRLGRLGRRPDLLISDYRLTNENGVESIGMLREEFNHDIPALLVTGDTSPDRLEEFRRMGLRVLYKPIAATTLLFAIREELKRAHPAHP